MAPKMQAQVTMEQKAKMQVRAMKEQAKAMMATKEQLLLPLHLLNLLHKQPLCQQQMPVKRKRKNRVSLTGVLAENSIYAGTY
jgi:hypothetical protein